MEKGLFNITQQGTTTLRPIYGEAGMINSIGITNMGSIPVIVGLYLEDALGVLVYVVRTEVPTNATLFLDENLSFDNSVLGLGLRVSKSNPENSSNISLSVIIK
tara:strand:- start:231 stop:542 length:312 start_codon:yes stop_codon:yes gene_type:complete